MRSDRFEKSISQRFLKRVDRRKSTPCGRRYLIADGEIRDDDLPILRRKGDGAYRQSSGPTTLLPQLLWPGMPDVHGALYTPQRGRSLAPGMRHRPGSAYLFACKVAFQALKFCHFHWSEYQ